MSVAAFLLIGGNRVGLHTVSLCTGLGGIERGLAIAAPEAFKPVLYVERELSVAAIIANEIEAGSLPAAPIWSDVKTITRGSVARYLDEVGVDCITGGYPCQPFSVAGKQLGTDDPRHLWPFIAQAIERYSPALCVFENVGGHLVLGFREVCECLERLGYWVAAGIFTASEVGANHRRERLFILAYRKCEGPQRQQCEQGSDERSVRRGSRTTVGDPEHLRSGDRIDETEIPIRSDRPSITSCFAPGPNADWKTIIERWPELAPATENKQAIKSDVRGLVDGVSRADQLRALGNSVVPQCAAVAFLGLWAALMEDAK